MLKRLSHGDIFSKETSIINAFPSILGNDTPYQGLREDFLVVIRSCVIADDIENSQPVTLALGVINFLFPPPSPHRSKQDKTLQKQFAKKGGIKKNGTTPFLSSQENNGQFERDSQSLGCVSEEQREEKEERE